MNIEKINITKQRCAKELYKLDRIRNFDITQFNRNMEILFGPINAEIERQEIRQKSIIHGIHCIVIAFIAGICVFIIKH